MFGIFHRKISEKDRAIADIESTMLNTFKRIQKGSVDPVQLRRRLKVVGAVAAMTGAIRDAYPKFPIEDENIVFAVVEANAAGAQADVDGLVDAIIDLVIRCPNRREAKIDTMLWMIAPEMMK